MEERSLEDYYVLATGIHIIIIHSDFGLEQLSQVSVIKD